MRPHIDVRPVSWTPRIFRPWVIASIAGICIGSGLLQVDMKQEEDSYSEPNLRAAGYDANPSPVGPEAVPVVVADPALPPMTGLAEGATLVPASMSPEE